jgi:lipid-binding SYLF domain-containing protein
MPRRPLFLILAAAIAGAADKNSQRLTDAAEVFTEIMAAPDRSIPQDLIDKAQCVIIVPGLKKAAFGFGGKFGKGYAACRKAGAGWGAPAAVRVEGGSAGFQIGVSSSDVVMLVMNRRGMERLLASRFTIGADARAAAGPVGREATAATDALLSAEILSWSRSRGAFAGVSLDGSTLRQDVDENKLIYGKPMENRDILGKDVKAPAAAAKLIAALNKRSMRPGK